MNSGIRNAHRAFTLIEILVSVAIIALLVAVLIPSLSKARQEAQATVCMNNIRQIATGWQLYAQEFKDIAVAGRFPTLSDPGNPRENLYNVGNGWKYRARWFAMLGKQIGIYAYKRPSPDKADDNTQPVDGDVFLDPAVPHRNSTRNYTYGYNFQFLGNSRNRNSAPSGVSHPINWPVKTSRIPRISETVMAADNIGTAASVPIGERLPYNPTGTGNDTKQIGNHAWSLDPPRLTPEGDFCDNKYRNKFRSAVEPRHSKRANVAFVDGHVERMLPVQLGYVINDDGTVPIVGEGNNRFFSGNGRDEDPPKVE